MGVLTNSIPLLLLLQLLCLWTGVSAEPGYFTNPIKDFGPDPWIIQKDGFYYYCFSIDEALWVAKAAKLQDVGRVTPAMVFRPPPNTPYSKELWAPELHYLDGKWYIYFTADDGNNAHHRMFVLESLTQNPQSGYIVKGKITDPTDQWAIDGTVLSMSGGKRYFVWSGLAGEKQDRQVLYLAEMQNPWTIKGQRVLISSPQFDWEKKSLPFMPGGINEAPEAFVRQGRIFVVFSASGAFGDDYCLGLLECVGGDVMRPQSWVKASLPVFSKADMAYGPGHASFVKSPDFTEDWIAYHACIRSGGGFNGRSLRIQKFTTYSNGSPFFDKPVPCYKPIPEPSGSQSRVI